MRQTRFHGRYEANGRLCAHPTCDEPGEFRAPGVYGNSFDGPGQWRWFCLDHIREFNAGYDWFEGMSAEEALSGKNSVAEGSHTAPVLHELAQRDRIDMPIVAAVVRILSGEAPAREVVADILARPLKAEVGA